MEDYRLDEIERPERHPAPSPASPAESAGPSIDAGGELPGRKVDGRRFSSIPQIICAESHVSLQEAALLLAPSSSKEGEP